MRSDDIVNVMYRENFSKIQSERMRATFFNSEKAMQGNKTRKQTAFAELRSETSSDGSRRKKLLDDRVNVSSEQNASIELHSSSTLPFVLITVAVLLFPHTSSQFWSFASLNGPGGGAS
ncbi:hypothetical protein AVEN_138425-1 [Araneus ventricosus]|uniref:Uncharacterized protein n=1 Tax=Araneus ventricosus TaxID=182803 RepID=A0A4Y2LIG2_ARAVE|nr:hypothetical protein AVEN_138425-1 [Araneus ventricosus]